MLAESMVPTLYEPGVRHAGVGQLRCFTVLPGSCVRSAGSTDTVRFRPVSADTRNIAIESKPVAEVFDSCPSPDT